MPDQCAVENRDRGRLSLSLFEPSGEPARALAVVGLVAIAVRVAILAGLLHSPLWGTYRIDTMYYRTWALRIAGGDWLGSGVFEQGPLYAYLLAAISFLTGGRELPLIVLQMLCGVLTAALVHDCARRLFGDRAALIAGLLAAGYGPLVLHETLTMKSFLEPLLVVLALWLLLDQDAGHGARRAALAGAAIGLAVLVREIHALLLAPAALFLLVRGDGIAGRRRVWCAVALGLGFSAAVLPVAVRNLAVGGEFLLSTSAGGENAYIAFGPEATGSYAVPPFVSPLPHTEHEDFREEARLRTRRRLSRPEASRFWYRESWHAIRNDPGRALGLVARKAALLFNDFEVPDNEDYRAARGLLPLLRALPTFGWIAGLGLIGLARAPGLGRRGWLLTGFVGTLVAGVLLTFNLGRYRLALAALLVVCAGAGADWLRGALRAGSRGGRRGLFGAGIAVAVSAYAFLPPLDLDLGHRDGEERRYREEVLAAAAQRDALPALAAAAAVPPPGAERLHALGAAYALAGLIPEAERAFTEALGADPGHLPSHWELARIADRTGRPAVAAARLRAMSGIAPDDPLVRFAFGSTLARLADDDPARAGQYAAEAREQLDKAVELEPGLTGAWYQLARISWLAGNDARAVSELARAIAAGPENAAALRLRERVLRGPEPL